MAFTFTDDLSTDLARLRFAVGDNISGMGIQPDGSNVADATMNALIAAEGTWQLAAVRVCETMAQHWRRMANVTAGPINQQLGDRADGWQKSADDLRAKYGIGAAMFSVQMQRADGYHTYNEFDDGDLTGEYNPDHVIFIRV
jgi:hypothetical protein